MKWQPIETAQKDRPILVVGGTWSSDGGGSGMSDNDYPLTQPVIACWQSGGWCMGNGGAYNEEWWATPTHWMPLPDPPSAAQRASAGAPGPGGGDEDDPGCDVCHEDDS